MSPRVSSPRAARSRRGLRWTAFAALWVSAVLPVTALLLTRDRDPCSTPGVPVAYPVVAAVCGWIGLVCCVLCLVSAVWWLRVGDAVMTGWQHGRWVLILVFGGLVLLFDILTVVSLHGAPHGTVPDCFS